MPRKPKYERVVDELEELHRLRKQGRAPMNTDQRFQLAFDYLRKMARTSESVDEYTPCALRRREIPF